MEIPRQSILEKYFYTFFENKIELIDGRLIIGNELKNSLATMQAILVGWGAEAGVALSPASLWWNALRTAYADVLPHALKEQGSERRLDEWRAWSRIHQNWSHVPPLGGGNCQSHREARQKLQFELFAKVEHLGESLGRDIVMRLGNDGFTPDIYFLSYDNFKWHDGQFIDGPVDIAIEVLVDAFEANDRILKFCKYEQGGVPEYWILDPMKKVFEAFQLEGGAFRQVFSGEKGFYTTPRLPGMKISVADLWDDSHHEPPCVLVEGEPHQRRMRPRRTKGTAFDLAFVPNVGLDPTPISFEEYISWAPEAKFEGSYNWRLEIGYVIGSRNVLGMLLMTFGLVPVVPLLPAELWVESLIGFSDPKTITKRKADVLEVARQAAKTLREAHHCRRIAVVGDLADEKPWSCWSMVELVLWDEPPEHAVWESLSKIFGEIQYTLHRPSTTSMEEYADFETGLIEL